MNILSKLGIVGILILIALYGAAVGTKEIDGVLFIAGIFLLISVLILIQDKLKKFFKRGYSAEWRTTDPGEFERYTEVLADFDKIHKSGIYTFLSWTGGIDGLLKLFILYFLLMLICAFIGVSIDMKIFIIYILVAIWPPATLLKNLFYSKDNEHICDEKVKDAIVFLNDQAKLFSSFNFRAQVNMKKDSVIVYDMRGLLEPVEKDDNMICAMINVTVNNAGNKGTFPYAYMVLVFKDAVENGERYRKMQDALDERLRDAQIPCNSFSTGHEYDSVNDAYVWIATKSAAADVPYYTNEEEMFALLSMADVIFQSKITE